MKVKSIMNPEVTSCHPGDALSRAAQIMWERDCGVVPVVAPDSGRLLGVVTDRDLCMAALLSNRPPYQLQVSTAMAKAPCTVTPEDSIRDAHASMRDHQVRRLPVVDDDGRLVGLVALNDLAVEAFSSRSQAASKRQRDVARTLAAISQHRIEDDEDHPAHETL